jgi:hypothetical protein
MFQRLVIPVLILIFSGWFGVCHAEEPIKVTLCKLLQNPDAYNRKLIEIRGSVSRGFEDFTLSDQACHNSRSIWLEFGGKRNSETIYCCGVSRDPTRARSLVVEGVETSLVEDELFLRFQKLTMPRKGGGHTRATIIGRYFAGSEVPGPNGVFRMGYGHMGGWTLLVIQQV